jgi:four helix bundle protein
LDIYRNTKNFPKDEWFGMRVQLRRAAVSVSTNIVEGNARKTTPDYLNFLYIALGSACELKYLVNLSVELGLIGNDETRGLPSQSDAVVRQLQRLVESMEREVALERAQKNQDRRPQTADRRPA